MRNRGFRKVLHVGVVKRRFFQQPKGLHLLAMRPTFPTRVKGVQLNERSHTTGRRGPIVAFRRFSGLFREHRRGSPFSTIRFLRYAYFFPV